ncbi:hypothetical protein MPRF_29970 [Mycolicibacterium parafortuitum]|uniref:Uncharacterized protein n=1 Tax=Mycolicibacterium parafortuitum TaxID=39692 RepID=A0A7I7U440_MYCPF|nr:hypothetical protein [Mycolicibacterium parafortuitum]BBY76098.1 hypothetical protein MPRF_29970 [Mycolicibacterium parafortuitum]
MGYHLDVITDDVGEAIRYAGGLMFDCCRAGWQVVVTTDDVAHTEALAILGVRAQSPGSSESAAPRRGDFRAVVSRFDHAPTTSPQTEDTRLHWADDHPEDSDAAIEPVRYRLSAAARAFKARALIRAGLPQSALDEQFWTADGTPLSTAADGGASRLPTRVGEYVRG